MRRFVLLLAAGLLVLTAVKSTQAASLSFTGYVDSEIKYTPEDKWTGRTGIEIGAEMGAVNKYSLKLGFFDEDRYFWEKYTSWEFRPSSISLYAQGRLWSNGPTVKGTLGDFAMLGPVSIAGNANYAALRGVLVEGFSLGAAKLSGYWGWPCADIAPLKAGPTSPAYGVGLNIANYKGLKLDAYGAVRRGEYTVIPDVPLTVDAAWIAPDGTMFTFDHIDEPFTTSGGLWLYTRNFAGSTTISAYSDAAYVREDGSIVRYRRSNNYSDLGGRPLPPTANSDYAYLIVGWTGADKKHLWMREHIETPYNNDPQVKFSSALAGTDYHTYSQAVGVLEGSFKVSDITVKGQLGRLVTVDSYYRRKVDGTSTPVQRDETKASFRIVSASTGIPLGTEFATKPLTITAEYRRIDEGFTPWARSTDPNVNRIEAQRGQRGINLQLSTTVLPVNPIDLKFTFDSYSKGEEGQEEKASSSAIELGTMLAGYEFAGKLGTGGVELGVARNVVLGIPDVTKLRPSLKVMFEEESRTTSTFALATEFNLGPFRKISADLSYEVVGEIDPETNQRVSRAVSSITASYTAPNGWSLKAGWRDPNDESKRDDTFLSLYYKVNI